MAFPGSLLSSPDEPLMFYRKAVAFLKRDLYEQLSFKFQFIFDFLSILAQCWTFYYLGRFVHSTVGPNGVSNMDYFAFLLVGTAVAGYQFSGLNSFAQAMQKEIGLGTLEAIFMTPTSPSTLIVSGALWSFITVTLRFGIYSLIGFLFGNMGVNQFNSIRIYTQ